MAKVNQNFPHEIYRFIHKPIRVEDQLKGRQFLERYIFAFQRQFEQTIERINQLPQLYDPALTPQPRLLKDIVGFTSELDKITNDISDQDLRKLISLAVALWKEKGLEIGYKDIIRLFTGKNSRVFNWFDFRYIVGEQGLSQEELGEDSWFISVPGVGAAESPGNVMYYLSFEGNFKDRSLNPVDALPHGFWDFFDNGPTSGSDEYAHFHMGGFLEVPNAAKLKFDESFTIEMFVRSTATGLQTLVNKTDGSGKGFKITYNSTTNEITYIVSDGVNTITQTLASALDLDDGVFRHLALIVNRTTGFARLYFNGTESTPAIALGALGDVTNLAKMFIAAESPGVIPFDGSLDNFRISKSAQYVITGATIPVPSVAFIEYQEEQLDEFFCDVRVVDEGDLNRILVLRILNLMRPTSERLRVIYIRFFEDFAFGKGNLASVVLGSLIDTVTTELVLPAGAVEVCDSIGSETFQDYVLQVRAKIQSGSSMGVRFLVQDSANYYLLVMRSDNQTFELFKVVSGVPTSLWSPVAAPIFNETYYVLSVIVDLNTATNETMIRCYQDRNKIFEVVDAQFVQGTWGVQSGAGSETRLSEIEMFLMPLEYDLILPNQVI